MALNAIFLYLVTFTRQHPVLMVGSDVLLCVAGSQQGSSLCYSLVLSWVLLLEDLQSRSAMLKDLKADASCLSSSVSISTLAHCNGVII